MHPAVMEFKESFEEQAIRAGQYRKTLGKYETIFLEEVWGPEFQYNFDGLKAEYPLKDFKGGDRFVDFVYVKGGMRLLIEIDGFTTHARDISPGDFDDHLMRQNDLILAGWLVIRFSAHQVEKRAAICRRQITQAIGHWWALAFGSFVKNEADIWSVRRRLTIQIALRQGGFVRGIDIAREFAVKTRTAYNWLQRFATEGVFSEDRTNLRNMKYILASYTHDHLSPILQRRARDLSSAARDGL